MSEERPKINISIGGNASIGEFVGGNKTTTTQNAGGDIVGGNKTTGLDANQLAELMKQFVSINQRVDALPHIDDDEKAELKDTLKKVEEEVKKGEEANPNKVERWIKFIAGMSEDIFKVTAASLTNPAAGVATAIKLIVEKANSEQ
jgi:hypothetical protein